MSDTKDAYQRFVSEWMSKHPGHAPTSRAAWDAAIAHSQAAPTQALLGWTRYEKARKLNVAQWAELHQRNLRGEPFDDMIDALPATTQPVQQDTRVPIDPVGRFAIHGEAMQAAPKCNLCGMRYGWHEYQCPNSETAQQAAPSGEDNHG